MDCFPMEKMKKNAISLCKLNINNTNKNPNKQNINKTNKTPNKHISIITTYIALLINK